MARNKWLQDTSKKLFDECCNGFGFEEVQQDEQSALAELEKAGLLAQGFGNLTRKEWATSVKLILDKHNVRYPKRVLPTSYLKPRKRNK